MQKDSVASTNSAPVELRYHYRRFTLDDARNGVNPVRLPSGPMVNGQQPTDLFYPPELQFRYKEKTYVDGDATFSWSPWLKVEHVSELPAPVA